MPRLPALPLAAALCAISYACFVPDVTVVDGKACSPAHPCVRGACLAGRCRLPPPGQDASTNPVMVTRARLHVLEDGGVLAVPEEVLNLAMLVERGDGGYFTLSPSQDEANDSIFWEAPPGDYVLRFGSRYFLTAERLVDLSEPSLGRPDLAVPAAGTALRVELTCLEPWDDWYEIQLTAIGASIGALRLSYLPGWSAPTSDAGQVAVAATLQWTSALTPGLIQSSLGDRPVLAQLADTRRAVNLPDGGTVNISEDHAVRFVRPGSLEMTQGAQSLVRECAQDPPSAFMSPVRVRGQAFAALTGQPFYSGADIFTATLGPYPGGLEPQVPAWPAPYRDLWSSPSDVNVFQQVPAWSLTPYPAEWPLRADVVLTVYVPVYLDPGDAGSSHLDERIVFGTHRQVSRSGGGELAPALGPPRDLRINGVPATGLRDAGIAPLLTWSPPALGTPTAYEVAILREQASGFRNQALIATLWTSGTRIRMPPGLIKSTETYTFRVRAVAAASLDVRRAPLRFSLPYDEASAISGLVIP